MPLVCSQNYHLNYSGVWLVVLFCQAIFAHIWIHKSLLRLKHECKICCEIWSKMYTKSSQISRGHHLNFIKIRNIVSGGFLYECAESHWPYHHTEAWLCGIMSAWFICEYKAEKFVYPHFWTPNVTFVSFLWVSQLFSGRSFTMHISTMQKH